MGIDSSLRNESQSTVDKVNPLSLYIPRNIRYNIIVPEQLLSWRNVYMSNLKIGEKIKIQRRERDLTQEEVANILGVSKAAVSKWKITRAIPI